MLSQACLHASAKQSLTFLSRGYCIDRYGSLIFPITHYSFTDLVCIGLCKIKNLYQFGVSRQYPSFLNLTYKDTTASVLDQSSQYRPIIIFRF